MRVVQLEALRAGDILLCYKDSKFGIVETAITHATRSEYTHAAICIDSATAAESRVLGGVRKVATKDLVKRYDHVAVFRQPDAWQSEGRVRALGEVIDSIIALRATYNWYDAARFLRGSDEAHRLSLPEQLQEFFDNPPPPSSPEEAYFCSQLVVKCLVDVGFITPSAAVVYKSTVTSPGALGRDPTFGTFYGYVSSVPNYQVPATDEFFDAPTYHDIFETDA